ncbi:HTH-Tnp-Tc5 domain containing protein [Pyrenophora tritici-repentis]|uniref:HTH-Tnp-Tc5 domain containing protein n=1 Tax=Pyrenophora tritici-repentis TaxID=45151 RepID=A0A834VQ19_9PLEO|nr:HTH-Tnp-Tc5 domain containing protein [Pyrenophora tritici-repentis]
MDPINAAIEFLESQPSNARSSYTKVAAQFGVSRHTLARQHQGKCFSHATKSLNQQLLSQQQELDLVNHIRQLTEEGLPPSRRMLQNFCTSIAKKPASLRWVSRFLQRHKDELKSHHGKGKDRLRHKADSLYKYEHWFQDLARILLKYHVRPGDIYNMDEKGFHLGRGEGTYRVFSRDSWERGGRRQPIQDGSREWLTVIAADTSFTATNVQSSFATTGIVPWEPEEVLKKFRTTTPEPPEYPTAIDIVNRRTVGALIADTVTPNSYEAAVVKETLLSLQAYQAILEHENNSLRYALGRKQRDYETPINALDVQTNRDNHLRALLLSLRTIRHATDQRMENEREIEEEKRNQLRTKELKAEAKLIAEEQARMKREERVIKDCEARNALKAIQTS